MRIASVPRSRGGLLLHPCVRVSGVQPRIGVRVKTVRAEGILDAILNRFPKPQMTCGRWLNHSFHIANRIFNATPQSRVQGRAMFSETTSLTPNATARSTVHCLDASRFHRRCTRRALSLNRGSLCQKTDTKSSDKSQNHFLHWIESVYVVVSGYRLKRIQIDRFRQWCESRTPRTSGIGHEHNLRSQPPIVLSFVQQPVEHNCHQDSTYWPEPYTQVSTNRRE